MNRHLMFFLLALSTPVLAHDEGHGPKLTDTARQGGVLSPVIAAGDASKGAMASVLYKAELVRSEDGTVRVFLYDKEMRLLDLSKFEMSAKGVLGFKKSKKWVKASFTFRQEEGAFVAKPPKAGAKPFNIDVHLLGGGRALLAAFENLD